MLVVGEHLLGEVDPMWVRMCTGLAAGVGFSRQELCGALSASVLLIGALYGRSDLLQTHDRATQAAARCRERFQAVWGATHCAPIRDQVASGGQPKPCTQVVERAVLILLEVLDEEAQRG